MKKIVALMLILVMALSFSAAALAADSPTIETVKVEPASEEGVKALEAAIPEQLGDKVGENEVAEKMLDFSFTGKEKIAIEVPRVRKDEEKIFVLYRDKDGNIQLLDAVAVEDGVVEFTPVGEGDYMVVRIVAESLAIKENIIVIPRTGDSNRLMKLVLVGLAAIAVMTLAGVAIKRSNSRV